MAPSWKGGEPSGSVSSNLTSSAITFERIDYEHES